MRDSHEHSMQLLKSQERPFSFYGKALAKEEAAKQYTPPTAKDFQQPFKANPIPKSSLEVWDHENLSCQASGVWKSHATISTNRTATVFCVIGNRALKLYIWGTVFYCVSLTVTATTASLLDTMVSKAGSDKQGQVMCRGSYCLPTPA